MLKGDIVKEALKKFPNTPSMTLAKKIYKESQEVFRDAEDARERIRYYRGQAGKRNKTSLEDKSFVVPAGKLNPFDTLPEGMTEYENWTPCQVNNEKTLILPDVHVPYHNKEALIIALKRGQEEQVDCVIANGDFADFYAVSWWERDPRKRFLKKEYETVLDVLDKLRQIFPTQRIIYKVGNHEERWQRYMRVKAPEICDMEILDFENLIRADYYNLEVVDDKRLVKIGRFLYIIHGHEFGKGITNPVNPARGLFLRGKANALCSHYHQTSQHTATSISGDVISCYSTGCLCDTHPEYRPYNDWNLGFAIVENIKGQFNVKNHKIIGGRIY